MRQPESVAGCNRKRESGVVDDRRDRVFSEEGAAVEGAELDEEGDGDDVGTEVFEEFDGGGGSATGGEEVIDEEDLFAGEDGVLVDFDLGFAVFEGVGEAAGAPGEFAAFADGDEAGVEAVGDGGGEDEAAGVDADDFVDFRGAGGFAEEADGFAEEVGVGEDGGDVAEEDAGFGEIGDIADGGAQGWGGHGRRMGQSSMPAKQDWICC